MPRSALAGAFMVLALCLGCRAEWAEVTLRDGRQFAGEIAEETQYKIVLRVRVGSMETPMTFAQSDVKKIDRKASSTPAGKPAPGAGGADKPAQSPADKRPDAPTGGFAVVPLDDEFGVYVTAQFVQDAIKRARQEKAEALIFEVNSPGGLVKELEAVRDALDDAEQDAANPKIGFYVQEQAFSAAALLCLSSRNFYVGKGARFGAAVGWYTNDTGKTEVDAKFNAAFASNWRGRAEKVGRPGILVDAMVLLEKEVYADTSKKPWELHDAPADALPDAANPSPAQGAGQTPAKWKKLDSKDTILALTADEAANVGAVDGVVTTAGEVARKLGVSNFDRVAFDGDRMWKNHADEVDRDIRLCRDAQEKIKAAADMMKASKTKNDVTQKIGLMIGSLQKIQSLYKIKSHVRNWMIREGIDEERISDVITRLKEVQREVKKS